MSTTADPTIHIDPDLDTADPGPRIVHRRCATQIGLDVRMMLCGEIRVGARKRPDGVSPRCERCDALVTPHRRACQPCQDRWGSP